MANSNSVYLCFILFSCLVTWPAAAIAAGAESNGSLTLKTPRQISFITDDATWLSLDASPTQDSLVIEVFGDLYTLPTAGGSAVRLTEGSAYDSQPAYSPNGKKVVFVSDRTGVDNLWVMNSDGGELRQLTKNQGKQEFASPSFAPDGSHVVVSRGSWALSTSELWAYHLDGGKGVQLTKSKAAAKTPVRQRGNYMGPVYSPDGRYLYYARKNGTFAYNLRFPQWQIARFDLSDKSEVILTAALGSAFRPQLSPDGKLLVYGTRVDQQTTLRVRNLETGDDRELLAGVEHDEQESRFTRDLLPGYSFNADGSALYVSRGGKITRVSISDGEAQRVPMQVAVEQKLAPLLKFPYRLGQGPVKARLLQRPQLSPDGQRVAFSAFSRIHIHNLQSNKTVAVSPESMQAYQPSWSPDGRRLVYVSWAAGGGTHLRRTHYNAWCWQTQAAHPAGRPPTINRRWPGMANGLLPSEVVVTNAYTASTTSAYR